MKKALSVVTAGLFLLVQAGQALAASQTFTVSATVPAASSIGIDAYKYVGTAPRTAVSGTALSFDPLNFNTANSIYLPNHYFSIDVSTGGGAGNPDVTVVYTEGANPNSPGHGLGWKTTATFMKVVGSTETTLAAHGPKKMLKDVTNEHITAAELSGAILKIYVGIVTKDPAAAILDPVGSEVITNADKPGTYSGSLLITATAV